MDRRVVITGLGLITPLGIGVESTWSALCAGRSGVAAITRFNPAVYPTRIAGEVKGFNAEDFLSRKEARRLELFIAFAIAAARMALADSGLTIDSANEGRVGVITGCGLGGLYVLEETVHRVVGSGPQRVSPFFIPMLIGNMAPGMVSIILGAKGPNASIATACAAGTHAIGDAFLMIKTGRADAMVTGGVEAPISPTSLAGFCAMRALSTRNDDPPRACRPFDRDRDGFVMGEGCGILILEELEQALARGARIYAEIVGYGAACHSPCYPLIVVVIEIEIVVVIVLGPHPRISPCALRVSATKRLTRSGSFRKRIGAPRASTALVPVQLSTPAGRTLRMPA